MAVSDLASASVTARTYLTEVAAVRAKMAKMAYVRIVIVSWRMCRMRCGRGRS